MCLLFGRYASSFCEQLLRATAATATKRYEQYKTGGYTSLGEEDESFGRIVKEAQENWKNSSENEGEQQTADNNFKS